MEIPDAYEEYVRSKREADETDKICTLTLPQSDVAAIWHVIADTVDQPNVGDKIPPDVKRRWESILRSLQRAITEAK